MEIKQKTIMVGMATYRALDKLRNTANKQLHRQVKFEEVINVLLNKVLGAKDGKHSTK
jgi:hypothetical protein